MGFRCLGAGPGRGGAVARRVGVSGPGRAGTRAEAEALTPKGTQPTRRHPAHSACRATQLLSPAVAGISQLRVSERTYFSSPKLGAVLSQEMTLGGTRGEGGWMLLDFPNVYVVVSLQFA